MLVGSDGFLYSEAEMASGYHDFRIRSGALRIIGKAKDPFDRAAAKCLPAAADEQIAALAAIFRENPTFLTEQIGQLGSAENLVPQGQIAQTVACFRSEVAAEQAMLELPCPRCSGSKITMMRSQGGKQEDWPCPGCQHEAYLLRSIQDDAV
jgi:hypothetical protein